MGLLNLYFLLLLFSLLSFLQTPTSAAKKPYVVYLGSHSHGSNPTSDDIDRARIRHHEFLGSFLGSVEEAESSIFHSYGRFINGFGAVLEEKHAKQIENHPGVVSVFPDEGAKLHTTRSWDFLGLEKDNFIPPDSAWKKARFGEDVIIANVDSGVWPESKSFADDGMGPIPSKWKGICQNDNYKGVSCNKKLIGIRYINQGTIEELRAENPKVVIPQNLTTGRDEEGHGTHTLATAGGNFVPNVSVYGSGFGTAKGGSPKARVAAYKVCWKPNENDSCSSADILSAYDLAIHDGVDVISASLGSIAREHLKNTIAIGSFHAMMNGIVSVAAAGNSGPDDGSVENVAPWILTVGASTTDREFTSYVTLGNKMVIKGASVSQKGLLNDIDSYPLIGGADARIANVSEIDASQCKNGSIDPAKVQGKILICYGARYGDKKGRRAAQAGAVGMILVSSKESGNKVLNMVHYLPTAHLNYTDGEAVYAYINSTQNPTASMTNSKTEFNTRPSRMTAFFTSRGPNMVDPAIFKPDVTAPGVDIIAAFTEASGPSPDESDKRRIPYIMMSGTSMSSPHVAGIVGLVKTLHPDWSPAAIKSAIMTTARAEDSSNRPILDQNNGEIATPFAYGAGHVNPNGALDPGLVYDLTSEDYLGYICDRGYNQSTIDLFTAPKKFTCPKSFNLADFNYPSIAVPKLNGSITFTRKVKNVGAEHSTYKARTSEIRGISTIVEPNILNFTKYGEEKTFKITFSVKGDDKPTDYVFGELVWSDGFHDVRSPIAVKLHQGFPV